MPSGNAAPCLPCRTAWNWWRRSPRWKRGGGPTLWTAGLSSQPLWPPPAACAAPAGGQARPAVARRALHRRPDGAARAIPGGRARGGRGPVHAAHLRGAGREGAAHDLRAHPGGAGRAERAGARLGNRTNLPEARVLGAARTAAAAKRFAENTAPVIRQVRDSGVASLRGIARVLTARGVRTARGGQWTATQVGAVLRRLASERSSA